MLKNKITIFIITLCFFIFPMQDGNTAEDDGLSSLEVVEAPQQTKSDTKQNGLYEPQNKAQALMKSGETPYNKQTGIDGGDDQGQGQGQIKQLQVTSENTIEGSITAKGKSEVSVGSTHLGEKDDSTNNNVPNLSTKDVWDKTNHNIDETCQQTEETVKCSESCLEQNRNKKDEDKCFIVDGCTKSPDHQLWMPFGVEFGRLEKCCTPDPVDLPCNNHDRCYQTCGHSQQECDDIIKKEMIEECHEHYLKSAITEVIGTGIGSSIDVITRGTTGGNGTKIGNLLADCENEALVFGTVLSMIGGDAYNKRQGQAGCK